MSKINDIVFLINQKLRNELFNTSRFQDGSFRQLAHLITEFKGEERIVRPMRVDDNGEGTDLTIDDTRSIQLYHRNTGISFEAAPEDNYGDERVVREIDDMLMIVISDRKKIAMREDELVSYIAAALLKKIDQSDLTLLNLYSCSIDLVSANVNAEEVYNTEYSGTDYRLKPNSIMLAISYRIVSTYSEDCLVPC